MRTSPAQRSPPRAGQPRPLSLFSHGAARRGSRHRALLSRRAARGRKAAPRVCVRATQRVKYAGEHAHLSLRLRQERHGRRLHGSRGPGVAWTGVLTWCVSDESCPYVSMYEYDCTLGEPLCVCHRVLQYKCSLGRRVIHGTIKTPSKREAFRFDESLTLSAVVSARRKCVCCPSRGDACMAVRHRQGASNPRRGQSHSHIPGGI